MENIINYLFAKLILIHFRKHLSFVFRREKHFQISQKDINWCFFNLLVKSGEREMKSILFVMQYVKCRRQSGIHENETGILEIEIELQCKICSSAIRKWTRSCFLYMDLVLHFSRKLESCIKKRWTWKFVACFLVYIWLIFLVYIVLLFVVLLKKISPTRYFLTHGEA